MPHRAREQVVVGKTSYYSAMEWLTPSQTGFQQAARYLLAMRLSMISLQLVAMAVVESVLDFAHRTPALTLCFASAVFAAANWLWFMRSPPRSAMAVSVTLCTDLMLTGAWLYLTGGYTNPLVSLLLLPISIGIVLVPIAQSIAVTSTGVLVYTLLVIWHSPVADAHHNADLARLHLIGMWATFALTAAILLLVVGALVRRLRIEQVRLASIRESRLRDEQIIALGLSAAAAAHRLGTPLNTMTLLVEEMRDAGPESPDQKADLDLLANQLALCTSHLQQLTDSARQAGAAQREQVSARAWLQRLRESSTLLWPGAVIDWRQPAPECPILVDATLDQAILNLIANATTASPAWVEVQARRRGPNRLELVIEDHGSGLSDTLEQRLGEQVLHSDNGMGVGLFLSNATVQRLGGTLKARVNETGTTMIVELPVSLESGAPVKGEY